MEMFTIEYRDGYGMSAETVSESCSSEQLEARVAGLYGYVSDIVVRDPEGRERPFTATVVIEWG